MTVILGMLVSLRALCFWGSDEFRANPAPPVSGERGSLPATHIVPVSGGVPRELAIQVEIFEEARRQFLLGRLRHARTLFAKLRILNPSWPGGYYNLGLVAEARGRVRKAMVYYERFLAQSSSGVLSIQDREKALGRLDELRLRRRRYGHLFLIAGGATLGAGVALGLGLSLGGVRRGERAEYDLTASPLSPQRNDFVRDLRVADSMIIGGVGTIVGSALVSGALCLTAMLIKQKYLERRRR